VAVDDEATGKSSTSKHHSHSFCWVAQMNVMLDSLWRKLYSQIVAHYHSLNIKA
jgi:hypothetical protein